MFIVVATVLATCKTNSTGSQPTTCLQISPKRVEDVCDAQAL